MYGGEKSETLHTFKGMWSRAQIVQFHPQRGQEILLRLLEEKYGLDESKAYKESDDVSITNEVARERILFPSQTHPCLMFIRNENI